MLAREELSVLSLQVQLQVLDERALPRELFAASPARKRPQQRVWRCLVAVDVLDVLLQRRRVREGLLAQAAHLAADVSVDALVHRAVAALSEGAVADGGERALVQPAVRPHVPAVRAAVHEQLAAARVLAHAVSPLWRGARLVRGGAGVSRFKLVPAQVLLAREDGEAFAATDDCEFWKMCQNFPEKRRKF